MNNLSSDSIGYFSFERYNFTDFVKLTRIEIESRLKTKPKDPNFQMTTLDNGNYIIAYPASDYGYDPIFSLINKDLEFIKEIVSYVSITFNCYKNLVAVAIKSDFFDWNLQKINTIDSDYSNKKNLLFAM